MDIRQIPVADILIADYNPRQELTPADPEYQALQRSIDRWDVVEPLIWNARSKRLVGGHQRLKVLIARGDQEVAVSAVDLDDAEERALSLALNKIDGRWDDSKLLEVLSQLDLDGFDLTATGFDAASLAALSAQMTTVPMFTPAVIDGAVAATLVNAVTEREVQAAQVKQDEQFSKPLRDLHAVMCPKCGHEFAVSTKSPA